MGKFVVKEISAGYTFALKAVNGETIGTSEVYASKDSCIKGIECVQLISAGAEIEDQTVNNFEKKIHPKFEIFQDNAGEYRFRLKAKNGEIVLASEGYTSKHNCENGIMSVIRNAVDSQVVELETV